MASRYGLQIRAANPADAPGLAELMEGAGLRGSPTNWAERLDALRHEQGTVLLALEWGPPSGVIAVNWFRTLQADGPVAQIGFLLVAPDSRRRGIARLLLKAGAQAARSAGCDRLSLLVSEHAGTLRFFAHASGFEDAGVALTRPLRKASHRE